MYIKTLTPSASPLTSGPALTPLTVFEAATTKLDTLTDTVTLHICFYEDKCVSVKTSSISNNSKPWFTAELKWVRTKKKKRQHRTQTGQNRTGRGDGPSKEEWYN